MSVYEDLCKLGTPQGAFNQGSFRTSASAAGKDLTGGYCAGVALDWCRRVLLSRADRDPKFLNYGKEGYGDAGPKGQSRQDATTVRMANAYAQQGSNYVAQTNLQKVTALLPVLLNQPEQGAIGDFEKGIRLTRPQAELILEVWKLKKTEIDLGLQVPGQLTKQLIQQLIDDAKTREDSQHRALDSKGRGWANMAAVMDAEFREIRIGQGRQVSAKPFSGIQVHRSAMQKDFGEPGEWAYVLRTEAYELNCCTLVSLSPGGGGSGHAVAVHQREADSYDFFDPNFGVFRMSLENLRGCFQHLFWSPKFTDKAPHGNLAVYRRPSSPDASPDSPWTKMAYTIFKRAVG